MRRVHWIIASFLVAFSTPLSLPASGYLNPYFDPASLGAGNAVVARSGDLASIFFNPAGLARLEGGRILAGPIRFGIDSRYTRDPGGSTARIDDSVWAGFAGFSTDRLGHDLVLGAAVYVPYGLALHWPEDGDQRYSVVAADLKAIFITPTLAWRVNERISVGAGVSVIRSEADLTKKTNLFLEDPDDPRLDPAFDIDVAIGGQSTAYAVDAGVQIGVRDDLTWGISWISPVEIDLEGEFEAAIPEVMRSQFGGAASFTDRGRMALRMPHQVRTGILWEGIEGVGLSFDVWWLDWSTHETITFDYDNTTPLTTEDALLRRDWTDALSFQAGATWAVRPDLILRGGYIFDQTAVPDETLDPILPQADKSIFTAGAGYRTGRMAFDVALAYLVDRDRTTATSVHPYPTNGLYESKVVLLSFATAVLF